MKKNDDHYNYYYYNSDDDAPSNQAGERERERESNYLFK